MTSMQPKLPTEGREKRLTFDIFGHSHVGKSRRFNDDNYLCLDLPREGTRRVLLSVADGLGGHAGGYIASHVAVESLREEAVHFSGLGSEEGLSARKILETAFQSANSEILSRSESDENLRGMGTTLVAALVVENHVTLANVGDSRAYLIRGGQCRQVTEDHSWRVEQRRRGVAEDEMRSSPFWSTITRCVGFDRELEVDVFEVSLESGDGLLLCTDGLWEILDEQAILEPFEGSRPAEEVCRSLVAGSNDLDGSDNITGVVLRSSLEPTGSPETRFSKTVPLDFGILREMRKP